jgi:predicted DNA-binding antitoxin AbrB/MazE fold protein
MTQTITATFEDGVLKPTQSLDLPEHAHVRLTIEPIESAKSVEEKLAAWDNFMKTVKPHPGPHLTRDELNERH